MEITKNIHQLKHEFSIELGNGNKIERVVNSLIIFDKDITLIDTGTKISYKKIKDYIESNGREVSEVKKIILTHSHPDHIGAAHKIKEDSGCTICSHAKEKGWIEDIEIQMKERPVPGFLGIADTPVKVDKLLYGNEIFNLGSIKIEIINSPGHSPGSINILFKDENILFTADSIPVKGDIPNYDNFRELCLSLKGIIRRAPYNVLLSSWSEPVYTKEGTLEFLEAGLEYLNLLNSAVTVFYTGAQIDNIENCRKVIEYLGFPNFMVNPIVHKSFLSHLSL